MPQQNVVANPAMLFQFLVVRLDVRHDAGRLRHLPISIPCGAIR